MKIVQVFAGSQPFFHPLKGFHHEQTALVEEDGNRRAVTFWRDGKVLDQKIYDMVEAAGQLINWPDNSAAPRPRPPRGGAEGA